MKIVKTVNNSGVCTTTIEVETCKWDLTDEDKQLISQMLNGAGAERRTEELYGQTTQQRQSAPAVNQGIQQDVRGPCEQVAAIQGGKRGIASRIWGMVKYTGHVAFTAALGALFTLILSGQEINFNIPSFTLEISAPAESQDPHPLKRFPAWAVIPRKPEECFYSSRFQR